MNESNTIGGRFAAVLTSLVVSILIVGSPALGADDDQGPVSVGPGQASPRPALRWYALEREELRWKSGLWTAPSVRREKERQARSLEWAWLLTGNLAAGYDSNVFESPEDETGSGLVDAGFRAELRRYLNRKDRLRFWGQATAEPFTSESEPDAYTQRIGGQYRRRASAKLTFHLLAEVKHENDNVVNTEGEDPLRDFEHLQYVVSPSFRYKISDRQSFWGFYNIRRRDYTEQAGLSSLDWWWHGPSFRWRRTLGARSDIEIDYTLRMQDYDDEPAELADGTTQPGNPEEEHRFHSLEIESFWRPHARMELGFLYEFDTKDDRFQDYESWDNHRWGVEATWLVRELSFRLAAAYDRRDYDKRPGDGAQTLEYDRVSGEASIGYAVTSNLTAYLSLTSTNRDTNRSTGNDFRDYDIRRVVAGIAFTY